MEKIEIDSEQLKDLTEKVCQIGESMGIPPDKFAIMLSIVSKYLSDSQGIEVTEERREDA